MFLEGERLQLKKLGVYLLKTKLGWVPSGIIHGEKSHSKGNVENLALLQVKNHKPRVLKIEPACLSKNVYHQDIVMPTKKPLKVRIDAYIKSNKSTEKIGGGECLLSKNRNSKKFENFKIEMVENCKMKLCRVCL